MLTKGSVTGAILGEHMNGTDWGVPSRSTVCSEMAVYPNVVLWQTGAADITPRGWITINDEYESIFDNNIHPIISVSIMWTESLALTSQGKFSVMVWPSAKNATK